MCRLTTTTRCFVVERRKRQPLIAFDLEGFESNVDAVGAKVISTSDFGTMVREVRGGESYDHLHVCLPVWIGAHETVDQAGEMAKRL